MMSKVNFQILSALMLQDLLLAFERSEASFKAHATRRINALAEEKRGLKVGKVLKMQVKKLAPRYNPKVRHLAAVKAHATRRRIARMIAELSHYKSVKGLKRVTA